jgi:ornithine cyclodeaminase/alanine dehydrogenase-like protein (mu-crystallin family)
VNLTFVGADTVAEVLRPAAAVCAIEDALRGGLDPATDFDRQIVDTEHGQVLLMPSQSQFNVGVKLATVAPDNPSHGLPRIQALYVLLDATTLSPRMLIDGAALTTLRTPAVSIAAIKPVLLATDTALRLTVFGRGPQGVGHVATIREVVDGHRAIASVTYVVRGGRAASSMDLPPGTDVVVANSPEADDAVERADVIVCATTSVEPVFDSAATKHDVIVIAVGSHEPDRREVDTPLVCRAQVIVEDRDTALRESGDIVMAIAESGLTAADLIPVKDVVTGAATLASDRAVLFKSSGMSWEDIVIADAVAARLEP